MNFWLSNRKRKNNGRFYGTIPQKRPASISYPNIWWDVDVRSKELSRVRTLTLMADSHTEERTLVCFPLHSLSSKMKENFRPSLTAAFHRKAKTPRKESRKKTEKIQWGNKKEN